MASLQAPVKTKEESCFEIAKDLVRQKSFWRPGEVELVRKGTGFSFILRNDGGYLNLYFVWGCHPMEHLGFAVGVHEGNWRYSLYPLQTEQAYQDWSRKVREAVKVYKKRYPLVEKDAPPW